MGVNYEIFEDVSKIEGVFHAPDMDIWLLIGREGLDRAEIW